MLERLEVHSLGIIDEVVLELTDGFVALTGETGAGKSLLVESLKLLAGQRAQADLVRSGDERLRVQGWFTLGEDSPLPGLLEEVGAAGDGAVVIRRELAEGGRSRCWVNDVPVTAATLQRMAPHLLSIHGQHEQYGLTEPATQRVLVDDFGRHHETVERVGRAYDHWLEAADEVERLRSAQARRRDRQDAIAFQLAEIDAVDPRGGEDSELQSRRQLLRHAVRLMELSSSVLARLAGADPSTLDQVARAERELAEMSACGLDLDEAAARLAEARIAIEEVVREVQGLADGVSEDPAELESIESRLHRLDQLMLKYGSPIAAVLEHREALLAEREELAAVEERVEAASAAAADGLAAYDVAAEKLQRAREKSARRLAREVEGVLARLSMAGTRLELSWQPRAQACSPLLRDGAPVAFDAAGVEECELLIAPNPGEAPRPMARIASGGELSRLHLALRTALRQRNGSSSVTLLFDEVDSGLGGSAAAALAELLLDLAKVDQVLVVTHLPQVAASAAAHFAIKKVVEGGRAVTRVGRLQGAERELEVARMLAGEEITPSARAHARALMGSP